MKNLTFISSVFWKDKRLFFVSEQTKDIMARRHRAIEVASTYEYVITDEGVVFFPNSYHSTIVHLEETQCGCNCPDIQNRKIACKHIFAAAFLKGDKDAVLNVAPTPRTFPSSSPGRKNSRPQDIKVGKYFTVLDLLISDTALKKGIPNFFDWRSPEGEKIVAMMNLLCGSMLDPLCDEFNRISITRGYLSKELYKYIYNAENYPEGALAHGFVKNAGADVWVHSWEAAALELALYIQKSPAYNFDFIRVYPALHKCGMIQFNTGISQYLK